jgi:acyl-CoA reductase-like NAD-dependent aldehyde dehydrogenase
VDLPFDATVASQEVFGPVVVIFRSTSEQEALQIANSTRYGLAASIWTQDVSRVQRISQGLEFGDVWVNTYYQRLAETPFGGWKESGLGCELGLAGMQEYIAYKRVATSTTDRWHKDAFFPDVPEGSYQSVLPAAL